MPGGNPPWEPHFGCWGTKNTPNHPRCTCSTKQKATNHLARCSAAKEHNPPRNHAPGRDDNAILCPAATQNTANPGNLDMLDGGPQLLVGATNTAPRTGKTCGLNIRHPESCNFGRKNLSKSLYSEIMAEIASVFLNLGLGSSGSAAESLEIVHQTRREQWNNKPGEVHFTKASQRVTRRRKATLGGGQQTNKN